MTHWHRVVHGGALTVLLALAPGCVNRPALLHELIDARRIAAAMHVEFSKASDAANRSVMAESDAASAAAAAEARQAREVVARQAAALEPLVSALAFSPETDLLAKFRTCFAEYRTLDDDVLSLAVENTNVKAERLAFGPSRDAAEAFRRSIDAALEAAPRDACDAQRQAATAVASVLEIEILQPPHIAEADDAAMTRMEQEMAQAEAAARAALARLQAAAPQGTKTIATANEALDRFGAINAQIVGLSRRNSNVRSLALSLGHKRTVTAQCEDQLRALEEGLATRELGGTR